MNITQEKLLITQGVMADLTKSSRHLVYRFMMLCDFGKHGQAYLEIDPGQADRETIVRNFIAGEYDRSERDGSCPPYGPAVP